MREESETARNQGTANQLTSVDFAVTYLFAGNVELRPFEIKLLTLRQRNGDDIDVKLKALLKQLLCGRSYGNEVVLCENGGAKTCKLRVVVNDKSDAVERTDSTISARMRASVGHAKHARVMR
jgi:hypothetical protein